MQRDGDLGLCGYMGRMRTEGLMPVKLNVPGKDELISTKRISTAPYMDIESGTKRMLEA